MAEQSAGMQESLDIERAIASAYDEGYARFSDLGLDLQTYATRIKTIVRKNLGLSPTEDAVIAFVRRLHGHDLYLATACANEALGFATQSKLANSSGCSSVAWRTLQDEYKVFISDLARFFSRKRFLAQDLADNMLADLFFPDHSGNSRVASYDGRSTLRTWLRVVFYNRAINAQHSTAHSQTEEVDTNVADRLAVIKIDHAIRARRYEVPLANSVTLACSGLTAPERLLLLWRYEDGLPLQQIAGLLGIHQSNVTRRLERVYSKLRDQVVSSLSIRHGMSKSAVRECLEGIVDNPNHGISILESIRESGSERESADPGGVSSQRKYLAVWPNTGTPGATPQEKTVAFVTGRDRTFRTGGKVVSG